MRRFRSAVHVFTLLFLSARFAVPQEPQWEWTSVPRVVAVGDVHGAYDNLVLVLKNPAQLPVTMLWISNGGRDYPPWSGRHVGVLGIEDGRTAVGHRASIGDNPLRRENVPTSYELREDGSVAFRQVIGALAGPAGPPVAIAPGDGRLLVTLPEGEVREVPFDGSFLKRGVS